MSSMGAPASELLKFSALAVVDFELIGFNMTNVGSVRSVLLPLNLTLDIPEVVDTSVAAASSWRPKVAKTFTSMSCPRFIPTSRGTRLLFVAEHETPTRGLEASYPMGQQPILQRRLAVADLPTGHVIKSDEDFQPNWLSGLTGGFLRSSQRAQSPLVVDVGAHSLPNAPVHGCPEFVPSLYVTPRSITDTMMENWKKIKKKLLSGSQLEEQPQLDKYKQGDTFVFTSYTYGSASVLGVDAQVVAASLDDGGSGGQVSNAHLLYNVDAMPKSITNGMNERPSSDGAINEEEQLLRLEGCKPIRAAGRKGHMRLEWAFETLLTTLRVQTERGGYTTWLACTTADQKVAIVQSPKRSHWVNFSMPFPIQRRHPLHAATLQNVWCPRDQEDECFEVWSSPNPNEMAT